MQKCLPWYENKETMQTFWKSWKGRSVHLEIWVYNWCKILRAAPRHGVALVARVHSQRHSSGSGHRWAACHEGHRPLFKVVWRWVDAGAPGAPPAGRPVQAVGAAAHRHQQLVAFSDDDETQNHQGRWWGESTLAFYYNVYFKMCFDYCFMVFWMKIVNSVWFHLLIFYWFISISLKWLCWYRREIHLNSWVLLKESFSKS